MRLLPPTEARTATRTPSATQHQQIATTRGVFPCLDRDTSRDTPVNPAGSVKSGRPFFTLLRGSRGRVRESALVSCKSMEGVGFRGLVPRAARRENARRVTPGIVGPHAASYYKRASVQGGESAGPSQSDKANLARVA
jgi:hypothetical protein